MKEWKGNSNSAHAAIAAHRGGGKSMRQEDDFYATDPIALQVLLSSCSDWLKLQFGAMKRTQTPIWECACGNGNLAKILVSYGYNTIATDIKDRGYGATGEHHDFLKSYFMFKNYHILTNPPYSLATEFIEHALEILPKGGLYIALMNITYLAGQKRYQRVYSKGNLREIYVFSKRIECWKNGERPKDKCGSIANYAWYIFQKGYSGQPTIEWLSV